MQKLCPRLSNVCKKFLFFLFKCGPSKPSKNLVSKSKDADSVEDKTPILA
jgi:hypothetical protein